MTRLGRLLPPDIRPPLQSCRRSPGCLRSKVAPGPCAKLTVSLRRVSQTLSASDHNNSGSTRPPRPQRKETPRLPFEASPPALRCLRQTVHELFARRPTAPAKPCLPEAERVRTSF